jgi:hypothetical protein
MHSPITGSLCCNEEKTVFTPPSRAKQQHEWLQLHAPYSLLCGDETPLHVALLSSVALLPSQKTDGLPNDFETF